MPIKEPNSRSNIAISHLIIALSIALIIFGGFLFTLGVYALSGFSSIPIVGGFFYLVCVLVMAIYFVMVWKKEKSSDTKLINELTFGDTKVIVVESLSDQILKWIITAVAFLFVFICTIMALICVYGLYNSTVQLQAYRLLFGELIVIGAGVVVFVVWKKISVN